MGKHAQGLAHRCLQTPALERQGQVQLFVLRPMVGKRHNTGTKRLRCGKGQLRRARLVKKTLSLSQYKGVEQEPIFIDEVMLHQRLD